MVVDGEIVIAKCAFGRRNKHTAYLTQDALLVQLQGRELQRFDRSSIQKIWVRHRFLWLPLVLGGIMTPFAIVALIKTSGAFWLLFLTTLVGLFLLYYGYTGSDSFTISTRVKEYDYFIDQNKPHLKAFIQFVKGQLLNRDPFLYLQGSHDQWESWKKTGLIPQGTQVYLRKYDIPPADVVLRLDPKEQDTPLEFSVTQDFADAKAYLKLDLPVVRVALANQQ